jgi:hypothetical protein
MSVGIAGQAWAPRSWFLPDLTVSCQAGDGKLETFTGSFELGKVAPVKGVLTVGGTVTGTCGVASIDTMFRSTIAATDTSCSGATLVLGDTVIRDTLINFSEQPIEITPEDVGRGPLCRLAATQNGALKAQANALNKVLAFSS